MGARGARVVLLPALSPLVDLESRTKGDDAEMTDKKRLIERLTVGDDELPFVTLSQDEAAEVLGYMLLNDSEPEHPEPGTFVEWRFTACQEIHWWPGIVDEYGEGVIDAMGELKEWDDIEWKPITGLQHGQIAIDVPNIDVWPLTREKKHASRASLIWHFYDREGACFSQMTAKHGAVSYAEAEKMQR